MRRPVVGTVGAPCEQGLLYLETISIFDEENPYLYLKPPQTGVHRVAKWIPTTRCIRDLLKMVGFASVEEITPPYHSRPKGRYKKRPIYIARKPI